MKTLLLLLLSGCASFQHQRDNTTFSEYQSAFIREAKLRGIHVDEIMIGFGIPDATPLSTALHATNLGICHPGSALFAPYVVIDPVAWSRANKVERELLVMHELGHCILLKPHTTRRSIMRPQLITGAEYEARRGELLDELFSPSPRQTGFEELAHFNEVRSSKR